VGHLVIEGDQVGQAGPTLEPLGSALVLLTLGFFLISRP